TDEAKGLRRPPAPHPVSRLRGNPLHTSCLAQAELGPHGANHPEDPKRATIGVNLYSQWKGLDARIRRPPKEIAANPKLVKAEEYAAILKRIENAEERLVVRLLHDTGLRPSDIVNLRLADLATEEGVTLIRRRTQKTGTICESVVTMETAEELAEYVKKSGVTDHVFRGETDKPHRHRTWPNAVLRKHHAEGITPRTFRRTL